MVYKQKKILSYSSGGWEVQIQGVSRLGRWLESPIVVHSPYLLAISSQAEGVRELLGVFFIDRPKCDDRVIIT
jgi:hypothetical protein